MALAESENACAPGQNRLRESDSIRASATIPVGNFPEVQHAPTVAWSEGVLTVDVYPISQSLADAFGRMVRGYAAGDWTPGDPNPPRVSIDHQSYDYGSLCSLVEKFDDTLPDDLLDSLLFEIHHQDRDLKEDLGRKGSYSSAARALRLLIERRKERYRRQEEARRGE